MLEALGVQIGTRILRSPDRLADAVREIEEYFAHKRRAFDLDVDLSLSHGFRRLVQARMPRTVSSLKFRNHAPLSAALS